MTLPSRMAAFGAGLLVAGAVGASAAALTVGASHHAAAPATAAGATMSPVSAPAADSPEAVYNHAKDAVAYISAQTPEGQATGSGFLVSADGRVVTNEHVVDGAQQVTVQLGTNGRPQQATVIAADASKDLALLQLQGGTGGVKPLTFADSSTVHVGDTAYAIGNPYGLDHTFTHGIVSALGRQIQAPDGTAIGGVIQTDAPINPGNSGGALLDASGQVIGVNSQIATSGSQQSQGGEPGNVGIGFAIPANAVKAFVAHPTSTASQATAPDATPGGLLPELMLPQG
jgi:putative serine protease PepD